MLSGALAPSALQGRSFADCPGSASQDLVCLHLGKPLSWLLGSVSDFNPRFPFLVYFLLLQERGFQECPRKEAVGNTYFFACVCLRISLLSLCSWLAGELPVELQVENEFSLGFPRWFTGCKLPALLLWSSFLLLLFLYLWPIFLPSSRAFRIFFISSNYLGKSR